MKAYAKYFQSMGGYRIIIRDTQDQRDDFVAQFTKTYKTQKSCERAIIKQGLELLKI